METYLSNIITGVIVAILVTVSNYYILKILTKAGDKSREEKADLEMIKREIKVLVRSLIRMNGWGKSFELVYDEEWDRYEDFDKRKQNIKEQIKH